MIVRGWRGCWLEDDWVCSRGDEGGDYVVRKVPILGEPDWAFYLVEVKTGDGEEESRGRGRDDKYD